MLLSAETALAKYPRQARDSAGTRAVARQRADVHRHSYTVRGCGLMSDQPMSAP